MFELKIEPVDLNQPVNLPTPWPELEARGFHGDLLLRAKGFELQARRLGFAEPATEFLARIGEGFLAPFRASEIVIANNDKDHELKQKALVALQQLSDEFGDRVSSIVWKTLAFLATRPDPLQHATILESKEYLPFPWWVADTCLHGLGKVLRIQTALRLCGVRRKRDGL